MADSDNTTTLPFVTTRRNARRAVATDTSDAPANAPGSLGDPALCAVRDWQTAHARELALCRTQQRIETRLVATVGFPPGMIRSPDGARHAIDSLADLKRVLGQGPFQGETQAAIDHWNKWQEQDEALGYSATKQEEAGASRQERAFLKDLIKTPAKTLDGVVAKLSVLTQSAADNGGGADTPLPLIQSALDDLNRISAQESRPPASERQPIAEKRGRSDRDR